MERSPAQSSRLGWLSLAGGFVVAVAGLVVLGWVTDRKILAQWFPGTPPVVMNTALGLLVCGAGLLALAGAWRRVAAACGLAVALFTAVVLAQFILGRSLGVDELFWSDQWATPPRMPGRMAPHTAVALTLVGAALVLLARRRGGRWLLPVTCGVIAAFAVVPLLGYLTARFAGASANPYPSMAVPTQVCLLVLAVASLQRTRMEHAGESLDRLFMGAAVGMLIAISVATFESNAEAIEANRGVVHTYEVRGSMDSFVEAVAEMESSERAYALTGRENFRVRADVHRGEIVRRLAELEARLADNPVQSARVARLRTLAEEKFVQSAGLARAREEGGVAAVAQHLLAGEEQPGQPARALVILADEVRAEEDRVLAVRRDDRQKLERNARTVQVLGSLFALGLLSAALVMARRATAARDAAEAELRDSEEHFRGAFEDAGIGMALVGLDGRWLRVNQALCDIVGYPEDELLKKTFQDITHPEDLGTDLGHVRDLIAGKSRSYQMEKRYLHRAGHVVWIVLIASLVRDNAGKPVHFVSQIKDITARNQAAEALRESEERFRTLADAAFEGIVVSEDGRILDANDQALALFGVDRTGLIGRAILDFVAPGSREAVAEAVRTGQEVVYEHEVVRADGTVFPAEIRARMMHVGQRRLRMTALRDISAQRQLEASLVQARDAALAVSRLKSEFLATVSHEIRTPMNGVLGMLGLLVETPLNEEQRQMSRVIHDSAHNLLTIISDILDISKIEAGRLRIEPAEFDLPGLLTETIALLAPRAQQKELSLTCDLGGLPAGAWRGDAGRIRQVFTNLLGNAIKFTDRGSVAVRTQVVHDDGAQATVRVSVTDTGVGVPREAHARLFQPFTQVDSSSTRRFGGTGLGLAISRQLVGLMGGEIGFTSGPGQGSTFWFELPLVRSAAPHRTATAAQPPAPTEHRRRRLLLVDDEPASQMVARMLLEKMGHAVEPAGSGEEALGALARDRHDAVLMDCRMPGLDGYEVTRRIRTGAVPGVDRRVPIIALTAYATADDRARCLAAGMDDYVSKPIDAATLGAALQRCGLGAPHPATAPAGQPPPEADVAVLDFRVVEKLRALPGRDGPSLWPEMLALFRQEEPNWLAELERLAAARSAGELATAAHRLASGCASLGAGRMRAAAMAVERAVRAGDWPGVAARLGELRAASGCLRTALRAAEVGPG